jgi:hypothetical protein
VHLIEIITSLQVTIGALTDKLPFFAMEENVLMLPILRLWDEYPPPKKPQ